MMKTKLMSRILCVIIALLTVISLSVTVAGALTSPDYRNSETGFSAYILDEKDLLSETGEENLLQKMIPLTKYGDVIFWSTDESYGDEIKQAKEKRIAISGYQSSCILAINTSKRKVTFQSDGAINNIVNASYARSITDNASHYASSGDYYSCAEEVYSEVLSLIRGDRIAEPMKIISLIVIGMMLAFVIVVGVVFGKRFNPLIKKNKDQAIFTEQRTLFVKPPVARCVGRDTRGYVTAGLTVLELALEVVLGGIGGGSGGSGGGSSGGGSSGGGSGGSSSY